MIVSSLLTDRLDAYRRDHDIGEGHATLMRVGIKQFASYLGREPMLDDLTAENLNGFVVWLADRGLAPVTCRGYRAGLVTLWRDGYETGFIEAPPSRLRKIKIPRRMPVAWSPGDVEKLLAAAEKLGGYYPTFGVSRRLFWCAWIRVQFDSALRMGDMLALRCDEVVGRDRFVVTQQKTGDGIVVQLHEATVQAVRLAAKPERVLLFGGVITRDWIFQTFGDLARKAGLSLEHGTTKMLRRASATAVEMVQPGAAMRHLGHRTPGLAYKHYVDGSQLQQAKPLPPALGETGGAP